MPTYQPTNILIAALPFHCSAYLGEQMPRRVAAKGAYRQRRQKRLDRVDGWWPGRTRATGQFYILSSGIWCHPDDLAALQRAIGNGRFGDKLVLGKRSTLRP
jgi:hypothetical protein